MWFTICFTVCGDKVSSFHKNWNESPETYRVKFLELMKEGNPFLLWALLLNFWDVFDNILIASNIIPVIMVVLVLALYGTAPGGGAVSLEMSS